MTWLVVDKATDIVVASANTRAEAYNIRTTIRWTNDRTYRVEKV